MNKHVISLVTLGTLLAACSSQTTTEQTQETSDTTAVETTATTETSTAFVSKNNTVTLKGVYATSIKSPHSQYDYTNLFDDNLNTSWSTMPGAGPDEGIMLYFNEPTDIEKIQIRQSADKSFSKLTAVTIYANGQLVEQGLAVNSGPIEISIAEASSLFIRLSDFDQTETKDDGDLVIVSFPKTSSVAIAELSLFGKDGKIKILPPTKVKGSVEATSTLAPALSYGVRNLFDSRKEFVWVEGAPGNGENQSITVKFQTAQQASGIRVMNGFQRSDKHFTSNARAKKILVTTESGGSQEITLDDEQGEQAISFTTPMKGSEFKFTIKEAYPGTAYKDLVLSELKLTGSDGDFIVEDAVTETIKSELITKAKDTPLEGVLDYRVYNSYVESDLTVRSIILRSDYTFVAYMESSQDNGTTQQKTELIADGNWELKSLNSEEAKVRVFGKLIRLSETTDYYAGDTSDEYLQIFQDNLTITEASITGEKFIEEIKRKLDE